MTLVTVAVVLLHGTLSAVAFGALNGNRLWVVKNETRRLLMGDIYTDQWHRKIQRMRYLWLVVLGFNAGMSLSQLYAFAVIVLQ